MRFSEFLLNELNVPPHLPQKWWRTTKEKAKELENIFVDKKQLFDSAEKIADEYGFNSPRDIYLTLDRNFRDIGTIYVQTLSQRMTDYENMKEPYYKDRFRKDLNLIDRHNLDFKDFTKKYARYFKSSGKDAGGQTDYHYALDQIESNRKYDEEADQKIAILRECKKVLDAIIEYFKILRQVKNYLDALDEREGIDRARYTWNDTPKKKMPAHNPIETLYHATPFMREILSTGFKTKKEVGIEGLGGDTQDAISFTADLNIGKEIANSLKDVINIAKGNINIGYIIKLAKSEGIDTKKFEGWITDMKWRSRKQQYNKGLKQPFYVSKTQLEPSNHDDIIYQTYELYRNYLAHTIMKYNPLFFGVDIENFKKMDVNNVGVLSCQVKMDTVIRYLASMEEYRVPVNGILSARKAY